jgi:predicted negative regulator of RcsB-dependent stress response
MTVGDWLVVLTILALCFAIGWLDFQKPQVIYIENAAHEFVPPDPRGIPLKEVPP